MKAKKNTITLFFVILLLPVFLAALFVIVVDPFFHYHAPLPGLPYVLSEERYQNDGIVKHFSYEALITGSSTTQNFKTSDVERLFGLSCVKVPFAGGSFRETGDITKTALKHNRDLKLVIRGLDMNRIDVDKDDMDYDDIPAYLYDQNPFNDYDYLFNEGVRDASLNCLKRWIRREGPTSFDEYSYWNDGKTFGREAVLSTYERIPEGQYSVPELTEEDYRVIRENLQQNVIDPAEQYPDVTFCVFVPPASVCVWDSIIRVGSLDRTIETLRYAYELLLDVENIKVYGFDDCIDITGNLDNYMDTQHYSSAINTYMLECMATGEKLLTKENITDYLEKVRSDYADYDYESIYEP